jgi:cytochrome oxidase Cu insertion factor (SCO1/SenC/PrrC family)
MSKATTKIMWAVPALLALALVFALGCGTISQSAPSMASVSAMEALPPLGNQVGNRIYPFTLRLVDGSMVTSADLANHRPAFLLFFKVA